jgi:hypothetical protein
MWPDPDRERIIAVCEVLWDELVDSTHSFETWATTDYGVERSRYIVSGLVWTPTKFASVARRLIEAAADDD